MKQKLPRQKRDRLAQTYGESPLLWIWRSAASYLEREMESLAPTPEDFFLDILAILDDIKGNPTLFMERRIASLWEDVANETRRVSPNATREDCDRYATIIVTTLLLLLRNSSRFYYSSTFYHALANRLTDHTSARYPQVTDDMVVMKEAARELERYRGELTVWLDKYLDSNHFLTDEIQRLLKDTPERKQKPRQNGPYTLTYNYQGKDRAKRIQQFEVGLVKQKLLRSTSDADQMEGFFSGENKDCGLKWIGKQELLYQLIRTLLKQEFISQATNVSAKSVASTQFGFDNCCRRTLKPNEQVIIDMLVNVLNPDVPLPLPGVS